MKSKSQNGLVDCIWLVWWKVLLTFSKIYWWCKVQDMEIMQQNPKKLDSIESFYLKKFLLNDSSLFNWIKSVWMCSSNFNWMNSSDASTKSLRIYWTTNLIKKHCCMTKMKTNRRKEDALKFDCNCKLFQRRFHNPPTSTLNVFTMNIIYNHTIASHSQIWLEMQIKSRNESYKMSGVYGEHHHM